MINALNLIRVRLDIKNLLALYSKWLICFFHMDDVIFLYNSDTQSSNSKEGMMHPSNICIVRPTFTNENLGSKSSPHGCVREGNSAMTFFC